jgi:hypothetical protein
VTSLGPRTLHQPEKLQKLSKNDLVVHPVFFRSIEKRICMYFEIKSAARSQACSADGATTQSAFLCNVLGMRIYGVF